LIPDDTQQDRQQQTGSNAKSGGNSVPHGPRLLCYRYCQNVFRGSTSNIPKSQIPR
jgi:hypothetical protein